MPRSPSVMDAGRGGSAMAGSTSKISSRRSMAARPRSTSEIIQPNAAMGHASTFRYRMNATRSATPVCSRRVSHPPYHSTTSTVKPCSATMMGLIMPR